MPLNITSKPSSLLALLYSQLAVLSASKYINLCYLKNHKNEKNITPLVTPVIISTNSNAFGVFQIHTKISLETLYYNDVKFH